MASQQLELLPSFGATFLEDYAGLLVTDTKVALIELLANSWDAGADRVDIVWPLEARPDQIAIADYGTGMMYDQFIQRWTELNYNRSELQGDEVVFPCSSHRGVRKAYGRNSTGRHSVFCFANEYTVETQCNGEVCHFLVRRTSGLANKAPFTISPLFRGPQEGHGTRVSAEIVRNAFTINKSAICSVRSSRTLVSRSM